jgi:leucine dehydrogenase
MAVVDLAVKGVTMRPEEHANRITRTGTDSLFRYAEVLNYGDVHIKFDPATGLRAIVAIHNLNLGPAIGGCRIANYGNVDDAIEDALRLGYMMSYKAAISNLPHGGAKAVIIKPKVIKDRRAFLLAFGDFVNDLGGRYITAMDSGTSESDMDIIAERTKYVTCTSASGAGGDPSPTTAFGVRRSIEAAVKFKLGKDNIEGVHVTIQGAGNVGYYLAKELHALGARITMCDINPKSTQRCVDEFRVAVVSVNEIYDVAADVFAPCALGKVLNLETIKRLRVGIVAGSANNQLAHHNYGTLLHERGILYAPDFVANAGGLIYVAAVYDHGSSAQAHQQVSDIYESLMPIFERSISENVATNKIAEQIALSKMRRA